MIDQFLNYLRFERNASPQTVQTYEDSLREFESYLTFREDGLSFEAVDTDLIRDWMESLMDRGNNASTINKKLSALRSFFRYALKRKLVKKDPAHAVGSGGMIIKMYARVPYYYYYMRRVCDVQS